MTTWSESTEPDDGPQRDDGAAADTAADEAADSVVQGQQDSAPAPLDVAETGEPRVDAAVDALRNLDDVPTSEHADVYEDVHRRLHSALTELDTE